VLSAPYRGQIGFAPPPIKVTGLPNSAGTVLPVGKPVNAKVEITNNGVGTEDVFLDPRTPDRQNLGLLSLTPATELTLPLPGNQLPPLFLVPTETNAVGAFAQATQPITFDFGFGDPDLAAINDGNSASGVFQGPATPGIWDIAPDAIGPFSGPVTQGKVSTGMVAATLGFDPAVASSTGDVEAQAVDPNAAGFSPLTLGPGQNGAMALTITPSGKKGTKVKGTLFVDVFDSRFDIAGEVVALPYQNTIGGLARGTGIGRRRPDRAAAGCVVFWGSSAKTRRSASAVG
jgi:hypothetical protein